LPRRSIGKTGIEVSTIGLGTVKFGRNQQVAYPTKYELPTDGEVASLLELCRQLGINLLDTAPAYGVSEERLGKLLPGRREDWVLSTKFGEEWSDSKSRFDFTPAHMNRSIDRSLKRLETTYLDAALIHSDGNDVDALQSPGLLDALARRKSQGDIRSFGISVKSEKGGLEAISQGCDLLMVMYSPWHPEMKAVLDAAQREGVGVFIKKAFSGGHFGRCEGDPVKSALTFIAGHPAVSSVVTGTINPLHLRQNCEALIRGL
jgi:aryl-alcohol dehydrogenase-like predicted oxidoreductase